MKRWFSFGTLISLLALAQTAMAEFARFPEVSVERLIANTSAYIREHPNDPMGPYTLGRIHYLALAKRSAQFSSMERSGRLPAVDDWFGRVATPPAAGTRLA